MKHLKQTLIVSLIIVLVGGSVVAQEIFEQEPGLYSTRELKASAPAPAHGKIIIKSAATLRGELRISTSSEPTISVVYTKKAKTKKKSTAIDYVDQIAISLSKLSGGARLEFRAPNPAPWSETELGLVEAVVIVPEFCQVEIETPYFDIEADGPFESFKVPSSLGRLNVSFVTEELQLVTANRRVHVENIAGKVRVATTNSDLVARDIRATDGQASFRNENGDISILGVSGEINVKNSYGRIEIDQFVAIGGNSFVNGQYGPIEVFVSKIGDAQLSLSNRYEDIELSLPSDVSAFLSLVVEENGKIEVANFPFEADLVQKNRLSLIAGDGKASISGSVRGKGNLYVRGYQPEDQ